MKKNEFGYLLADSPSLTCKIWAFTNYWEALLIRDPDYGNAKQVFNARILWRKYKTRK